MGGTTLARYSYDAWGKCTITEDTTEVDIATVNPYRYRSYYYDSETQLYYLQSRYYDPETGRFLNADEAELLGVGESATSYNLFAYCGNDPVNSVDFSGYFTIKIYAIAAVTAAVIAAISKIIGNFSKGYRGKKLIAQTGIGSVLSLLIDLIKDGLEELSKK